MKYISNFVKKMREISFRNEEIKKGVVLWDSSKLGTYVKNKHNESILDRSKKKVIG